MDSIMVECEKRKKDKEIELWKRKFLELQSQFLVQKQDLLELKEELQDYKTKYDALSVEIQEKKIVIEEGKTTRDELNKCIEDYKRRLKELAVQADLRFKYELELEKKLEDCQTNKCTAENARLVNDLNECRSMCDELKKQIKSLEEEKEDKKAAIDEGEQCSQLYKVIAYLERQKRRAEDETEVLKTELRELKDRTEKELVEYKAKCDGLLAELKEKEMQCVGYESKLKNLMLVRLKEGIMGVAEARKVMSKGEKRIEEKMACLEDALEKVEGDTREVLRLEQNSTCDKEISPKQHNVSKEGLSISTSTTTKRCSDNQKYLTSPKRSFSGEEGEVCSTVSCGSDYIQSTSAPKRLRVSEIFTSNSENEEDDTTPSGNKRRVKQVGKLSVGTKLKTSPLNPSCGGQNAEKIVTATSRHRIISLRPCELGNKSQSGDTPKGEHISPDNLGVDGSSEKKGGNLSLGRSMPKGSESYGKKDSPRDSEHPMDNALDFGQNIEKKSSRCEGSKWQNEADMVLSLKENPTLCMKAVCALQRQHTQIITSSHCRNRPLRAFKKFAALSGSELAEFLMDGDPKGDLKKSQKELEMFKPEGLGDCKRLARYYSKRLFSIYISKKDPFFSPS